jgi:uncharacterized OB-fold protein
MLEYVAPTARIVRAELPRARVGLAETPSMLARSRGMLSRPQERSLPKARNLGSWSDQPAAPRAEVSLMRASIMPRATAENAAYRKHCQQVVLYMQRCDYCGRRRFPPRPMCPACRSVKRSRQPVSGPETAHAFSIVTGTGTETLLSSIRGFPFAVTAIGLDGRVKMPTDFDTADPPRPGVTAKVEAIFMAANKSVTIPRFGLSSDE